MQIFTYQNGLCVELESVEDFPQALLFAEKARGLADKFSIFSDEGTTLFGIYREGKGNLRVYEV